MSTPVATERAPEKLPRRDHRSRGLRRGEGVAGWLFVSPVVVILGVFLFLPVLMALWVSVSDWGGRGSPLSPNVNFVGLDNYAEALVVDHEDADVAVHGQLLNGWAPPGGGGHVVPRLPQRLPPGHG